MEAFQTEQESFWAGEFGDKYIGRNLSEKEWGARLSLFVKIMTSTIGVESAIEFGANIGNNLKVINQMFPNIDLSAVEINEKAVGVLNEWGVAKVYCESILDFAIDSPCHFAFVSGVLIHIKPEMLPAVYDALYKSSTRYICVIEYYNPTPVEVQYRGHSGKLFKRDFAGEIMDRFDDLSLRDYGFIYHRDYNFPLDDLTWFLLEKRSM